MTGWVIGGSIVTAVLVIVCLFISANALARRVRVIFTVGAVFGIVLLAAVPSVMVITSERSERPEASPLSIQMGMGTESCGSGVGGGSAALENNSDQEEDEVMKSIYGRLKFIQGVIASCEYTAPENVATALVEASEELGIVLRELYPGEEDYCSITVGRDVASASDTVPEEGVEPEYHWLPTERYLPPEDGWYIGKYADGAVEPVRYVENARAFVDAAGDKADIAAWARAWMSEKDNVERWSG